MKVFILRENGMIGSVTVSSSVEGVFTTEEAAEEYILEENRLRLNAGRFKIEKCRFRELHYGFTIEKHEVKQ